jgi:nucleotide-binding universal stress UspA family protein
MNFKKILIAVNSSAFSLKAAKTGFSLAQAVAGEVALVYVIDRSKETVNIEAGPTRQESEMLLLKEATETLDQLVKMYQGSNNVFKFMPEGFPKEEIINTAKEWEADVIVMGTHGRTGLSHLVKGNLAEYIIRHSGIPVLVIPPGIK